MIAKEKYNLLLKKVMEELSIHNFKRSGTRFYIKKHNNWGLIEFQKNRHSDNEIILFTISLGICSEKLMLFLGPATQKNPTIEFCQWQERIGFLMTPPRDYWWEISSLTYIDALVPEVTDILISKGVPEIINNISDKDLEKCWRNRDQGTRLTNISRLIYLSSLIKIYDGPDLREVATELMVSAISEGDPYFEDTAAEHIRKLGVKL
jgi:hypothetical protein